MNNELTNFNHEALKSICVQLAKNVLWPKSELSSDIVETLAAKFEKEACSHLQYIVEQERDPNIITRAVWYLLQAHSIPPFGTDTLWFHHMLTCLIELAVPNTELDSESLEIFKDIQKGIDESINWTSEE